MNNILKISIWIFMFVSVITMYGQDYTSAQRKDWLQKAELYKPTLKSENKYPRQTVKIIEDKNAYQGYKIVPNGTIETFYTTSIKKQSGIIIDFGEHLTGYFTFALSPLNSTPDAPVRFKFTFAEVASELAVPFDPYTGWLSRAWLQDETVTAMLVSDTITISRRLAFRYVKIELLANPSYDFVISSMKCKSITSADITAPDPLSPSVDSTIRDIDRVGLNTLKECMQTVYEDSPKRDQRLWIGDLYLESMANNYSYKQHDLTKRCLYLLAGLADDSGYLNATVFEKPYPHPQDKKLLFEYALLYNVTLKNYLIATGDKATVLDLWPVAKRQLDIVREYLKEDGMMDFDRANKEWWIFFDWKENLYKEVPFQGMSIYGFKESYELAKMLGKEKEVPDLPESIKKMISASRRKLYDKKSGLFVGINNKQISYASQIWMILSGVATQSEGQKALRTLNTAQDVCHPGTPYLYHYYIQSLIDCGMPQEAKNALIEYWGGMLKKGADTFWEAYDPQNDFISPYDFSPINSYCHAWSCTPVYFIRKYSNIFQ